MDTYRKPDNQRISGSFFVLLVFFSNPIRHKTLLNYLKEGSCVPKRVESEMLDNPEPYEFYGTMRMIRFS